MNRKENDETLVALTLLGRTEAYELLVLRWQGVVLRCALSVIRDPSLAEDAMQETFLSAWKKLETLKEPAKFGAWICRIAKNTAKNALAHRRDCISLTVLENRESEGCEFSEPSWVSSEEQSLLSDSLDALPETMEQAIRLHYYDGYSVAEIAKQQGIPVGTVKWRLSEGRRRIRKDFGVMKEREKNRLSEQIMIRIGALKKQRLLNNKMEGKRLYRELLSEVDRLADSVEKDRAEADILLEGWLWGEDAPSESLVERLRAIALRSQNDEVMCGILEAEYRRRYGAERVIWFLQEVPRLKELGFDRAVGHGWFWLGCAYGKNGDREKARESWHKALAVLSFSDSLYTAAQICLRMEEYGERRKEQDYRAVATAVELRHVDGGYRVWSRIVYHKGFLPENVGFADLLGWVARCDGFLPDSSMKVGEKIGGSDSCQSLLFVEDGVTVETNCGTFLDCEHWVTRYGEESEIHSYWKDGIGMVCQEQDGLCRKLISYTLNGGQGRFPIAVGNCWEYDGGTPPGVDYANQMTITFFDKERVVLSNLLCYERREYDFADWKETMLAVKHRLSRIEEAEEYEKDGLFQDADTYLQSASILAKADWQQRCTEAARAFLGRVAEARKNGQYVGRPFLYTEALRVCCLWRSPDSVDMRPIPYANLAWSREASWENAFPYDPLAVLRNTCGALWENSWREGTSFRREQTVGDQTVTTLGVCQREGRVETEAGVFEQCLRLTLTVEGADDPFVDGETKCILSPGVGIVRFETEAFGVSTVYELTTCKGVGEGYFPMEDGFLRRYDAIDGDGSERFAEYTCFAHEDGTLLLLTDRGSYRNRVNG